jgi:hypothetical protein
LFCLLAQASFVAGTAVDARVELRRWLVPGLATAALAAPWVGLLLVRVFRPSDGGAAGPASRAGTPPAR